MQRGSMIKQSNMPLNPYQSPINTTVILYISYSNTLHHVHIYLIFTNHIPSIFQPLRLLAFFMNCMFSITPPFLLYFSLSSIPSCRTKPLQSNLLLPTELIFLLRLYIARITWFRYWYAMCVLLRSNSTGLYSATCCSCTSMFCFFSTISSWPVSSLRMNSFPAKTTLLLGLMDSLLRIVWASSRVLGAG